MASWQPPIPAGALYSKPARTLGPALPLLAYCYDKVQRDGWFDIVLKEAAADMEEPYQNIKRWWQALENGGFFATVENHKRKGLRVQFKSVWIDWRILSARKSNAFDPDTEVPETVPNQNKGQFRDSLGTTEVPETVLLSPAYKVLIDQDTKGDERDDANASRTPRKKEPKTEKPPTPKPIRDALAEVCQIGKLSTREQVLQLNQSAAAIWKAQADDGREPEQIAADIHYVAGYFKRHDWRGKRGDIPRPADVREVWQPALAARSAEKPAATKYYQSQAHKYPPEEERRRLLVEGLAKRTAIRNVGDS